MYNQYPYLNLNDLNLDYILRAIKEMRYEVTNFVSINAIKYADPIQWDITRQYEKNTIVIDPVTGTAYISVAAVPAGVSLARTEYWTVVFDLKSFITKANQNLANNYESQTTTTATMNTAAGDWVIWGDVLYKALVNITAGDAYTVGGNIERITVEDVADAIYNAIELEVQARENADGDLSSLTTTDKSNLVAAINEIDQKIDNEMQARENADGDLSSLTTTDKSNLVAAINEINSTGGGAIAKIGDLDNLTTTDKSNVVNAINEIDSDLSSAIVTLTSDINANGEKLNNLKIYNILDYGAVGDGVTNDTQAFNDVIDILNTSGGAMYIPAGEYLINELHAITNGCEIFGVGSSSKITCNARSTYLFNFTSWEKGSLHDIRINDVSSNAVDQVINLLVGNLVHIYNIWVDTCHRFLKIGRKDAAGVIEGYASTIENIFGHVKDVFVDIYGSRSCIYLKNCIIDARATQLAKQSAVIAIDDWNGLDTLEVFDCLFQVFAYGLIIGNHNGITTSNIFMHHVVFDGMTVRCVQVNNYGNLYRTFFDECWFTMMDNTAEENVLIQNLSQTGGLVSGVNFDSCKFPYVYKAAIAVYTVFGLKITSCSIPTYTAAAISLNKCGVFTIDGNLIGYDGTNTPQPTTPAITGANNQRGIISSNYFQITTNASTLGTNIRADGNLNMADVAI